MEERASFTFWSLYRKAICPWDPLDNEIYGPNRQPTHDNPVSQMSSPQPITAMTARSWVIYKCTRAASCWVLTLFRVATLLHEMALLGVGLSAEF